NELQLMASLYTYTMNIFITNNVVIRFYHMQNLTWLAVVSFFFTITCTALISFCPPFGFMDFDYKKTQGKVKSST
ncbi:hypothetical protein PSY81_23725, partial [Shigella flexneri]|nr:hypothetical protein [Shigella flexneri]